MLYIEVTWTTVDQFYARTFLHCMIVIFYFLVDDNLYGILFYYNLLVVVLT